TAESCTGGLLSHRITNVPGSSDYFLGGVVAYSNEVKQSTLGIEKASIQKTGAVSEEVARIMAEKIRVLTNSDIGVGITGIAGPTGGSKEKPVGLVYIALCSKSKVEIEEFNFKGEREMIKYKATQAALNFVRKFLISKGR
ncbi:MAG: nicotinamide-nucleotide amidohydrolase family protein, partial [Candidatus Subteraquimicrobiales bacterium]|nr:nicotinamide-nucleotide amidohydrolase family protein [Candidatus Subteraquimicrobiales bacterium]